MAGPLYVVVDGSYHEDDDRGGAGLVLTQGSPEGKVIAFCASSFQCRNSVSAEYQAIVRGLRWAPGAQCMSDCLSAIQRALASGHAASFLPSDHRTNHSYAHRLSVVGRKRHTYSLVLDELRRQIA